MKSLLAATGIGLVFIYVIGSGLWVNTGDNWYRSLNQPPWQPISLQGAGLFHIAMGAVLGIAAYGRTKEKIEGASNVDTAVGGAPAGPASAFLGK